MKFLKRVFTIIIVLIIVVAVLGFFGKNKKDKEREARREGSSSRVEQIIREETSKEEFSKAESSKEEPSSEKPEEEPKEEPEEESEEEEPEEEPAEESQASGIRSDVKEAIDAYEAFIDEYCEFVTVYSEDPTNAELIAEYLEFVVKLEEEERKIDALDKDLTEEEDIYYTEVLLRCSEKLNEAALKLGE